MRAATVRLAAGRPHPPEHDRVLVELTACQVEMLLFFAEDLELGTVRARTCNALIKKGLIRLDEGSRVYRITELGQAVAALVSHGPEQR